MPSGLRSALQRLGVTLLVLAVLYASWEGFKWFGEATDFRLGTFEVNDRTLPHVHDIVGQLFEPSRRNGPLLIEVLWDAMLFTAKEAAVGFLLGASIGFAIGIVLAHSRLLQRGFLPYIVASQTVPILAIAPMVVIWLGGRGLPDWFSVAVISAYLTFFPVTINTLRGLQSADPKALELMDSYAANRWSVLWKVRVPTSLPYLFSAPRRRPRSSARSSASCPRACRTGSAARSSTSTSTTRSSRGTCGRRTSSR